jgi:flagellar protein FliS
MLALRDPAQAYRRVDFEARVSSADQRELVRMCYERVISSLGSAIHAHGKGDNGVKSQALTRALSALTALQVGVSGDDTMAGALAQFYTAARTPCSTACWSSMPAPCAMCGRTSPTSRPI